MPGLSDIVLCPFLGTVVPCCLRQLGNSCELSFCPDLVLGAGGGDWKDRRWGSGFRSQLSSDLCDLISHGAPLSLLSLFCRGSVDACLEGRVHLRISSGLTLDRCVVDETPP